MSESKTFDNKIFRFAQPFQIEVSKNSDNDVLIVEGDKMLWLSNETALDLATWILDNVSEVME